MVGPEYLATRVGVPVKTIYEWKLNGKGPRWHKIGRHLRAHEADIEAWISTQVDSRHREPAEG